ncbi:hypothetical protein [Microaceticoccus formicicus]|uniref:hypothetical protein n=1 Tax=Microaceticoccus formicicus TaxID=3118105 RepID=UPI003CD01A22|nr:hypothetical protein VZL98_11095 [Peptoniphilaceae bacterium AMB_02]
MLEQLKTKDIKQLINKKIKWNNLPLNEDVKSLLIGTSVFSGRDKEIISMTEGYYKVFVDDFCKTDNIVEKLKKNMNIIIIDGNGERVFRAAISE